MKRILAVILATVALAALTAPAAGAKGFPLPGKGFCTCDPIDVY